MSYPESESDGTIFEICKFDGHDWETSNDPIFTLNKLIPQEILEYFFFDGEQLNYYFKDKSGEKIKDAVFQISQLTILERLIDHLKNRRTDFRKKLKDSNPKAERIAEELELMEKSLTVYIQDYEKIKIELYDSSLKEDEYNHKLISKSDGKEKELRVSYKELESDLRIIERKISTYENDLEIMILNYIPALFTYECLRKTKELIKEKWRTRKTAPKNEKRIFERLIEDDKCICGINLSDNEECRNSLIELMENSEDISNISEELAEESGTIRDIIDELKKLLNNQEKLIDNISDENERRNIKNDKLNEVETKLEEYDLEDIDNLNQKLKEYKNSKIQFSRQESHI